MSDPDLLAAVSHLRRVAGQGAGAYVRSDVLRFLLDAVHEREELRVLLVKAEADLEGMRLTLRSAHEREDRTKARIRELIGRLDDAGIKVDMEATNAL